MEEEEGDSREAATHSCPDAKARESFQLSALASSCISVPEDPEGGSLPHLCQGKGRPGTSSFSLVSRVMHPGSLWPDVCTGLNVEPHGT